MADQRAADLVQRNDITGLFRYLGPMWLKVCMETLDELLAKGFYPNPDRYATELRSAGIFVERMEVAMGAVLGKNGRTMGYEKFEEVYAPKLAMLPMTQRREVRDYWFAGPKPGLSIPTGKGPPTIGARGDWYVTSLSAANLSLVIGAGFTVMKGTIEFSNVNGDKATKQLGLYGPSIGLSYTPNVGGLAAKLPGAAKLLARFPLLGKMVTGNEEQFAERVLLYLWAQSPKMRAAVTAFPKVNSVLKQLLANRNAASGGAESWISAAIGEVAGDSAALKPEDFSGPCVCYALTGAGGAGPTVSFGTYVLFFGIDRNWSPLSDPAPFVDLMALDRKSKGVAVIAAISAAAGLPSLSAGLTIFWGELS